MTTPQPQSETPETDAAVFKIFKIIGSLQSGTEDVVHAEKCRDLERRLRAAEAERDDLARWKREALEVANQLQEQEIGKEIGLTLGQRISPAILPWIKEAKTNLTALQTAAEGMEMALEMCSDYFDWIYSQEYQGINDPPFPETERGIQISQALTRYRALKEKGGDAT